MALPRLWDRGTARRLSAVETFIFPSGVRLSPALSHLSTADVATVEAATRQWFRLHARHPRATMSMPSAAVDTLWRELVRHERDYAAFCDAAFGRRFPYSDAHGALAATYRHAREDEPGDRLPLLFRVDRELAISGGRHYLADCGGRGQCFDAPGDAICLQHVAGIGRALRADGRIDSRNVPPGGSCGGGGSVGGGCGGGGCGGGGG